jgi:hypothetical protein
MKLALRRWNEKEDVCDTQNIILPLSPLEARAGSRSGLSTRWKSGNSSAAITEDTRLVFLLCDRCVLCSSTVLHAV